MLKEVAAATAALDELAQAIADSWTDQLYGPTTGNWTFPAVNRLDLSKSVRSASSRLKEIDDDDFDTSAKKFFQSVPERVNYYKNHTLPNISGDARAATDALFQLLRVIEQNIPGIDGPHWSRLEKFDAIPKEYAKRLRGLGAIINRLEPQFDALEAKLKLINEAYSAANSLPTDLDSLREARDEIQGYGRTSKESAALASIALKDLQDKISIIEEYEAEAKRTLGSIEEAYSAATTKGLAAAFTERANSLTQSTWIWVSLLGTSLLTGAYLGHQRLEALQQAVMSQPTNTSWLWLNAGMSLFAIAGPVWFAWLSTKQIAQRFRLAEDYGFKASVARAYEGYRKEATKLDPTFAARLFGSALDRLDEAPLRFLATEEHSSPYEALLASPGFQRALDKIPSLKETVLGLADRLNGTLAAAATGTAAGITATASAPIARKGDGDGKSSDD